MKYSSATSDSIPSKTREQINSNLKQGKGIFLIGGTGTGKTYILWALVNHFDSNEYTVNNFVELLSQMREYSRDGSYYEQLKGFTRKIRFIDDIGAEKSSDFSHEMLYLIINRFYENEQQVFLSSNLSLEEFKERYGDRILSRISEMCGIIELTGEDRRI